MKAPNVSQAGKVACLAKESNQRAASISSNSVTRSGSIIARWVHHLTHIGCSLGVTRVQCKQ